MKIKPAMLCITMALFGLSLATAAVAGDKPGNKPSVKTNVAPTPGPNDFLTDVDNENNSGTGTADGDMDLYLFNNDPVHPIEFNIFVTQDPTGRSADLRMDVFDVDTPDEVDEVFVNGTKVGTLLGSSGTWGVNIFSIPPGVLKKGKNTVKILVDTASSTPTWAVEVDWGMISLSPRSQVNIDKGWINPIRVKKDNFINVFAEISGDPSKISEVGFYLGNTKLTTLTDPDKDGTWSGQYQVTQAPGYYANTKILVKGLSGRTLSKWPGFTVLP